LWQVPKEHDSGLVQSVLTRHALPADGAVVELPEHAPNTKTPTRKHFDKREFTISSSE
jgi:hypothetical protein